jgi:hypothetical protein
MINLLYLLSVVPAEDWYRNWPASRTLMMRRTSKKIKKAMDKIRPPVNIRFINNFKELSPDLYLIYRIKKLELLACSMSGENKDRLVILLGQCPALVCLKIIGNYNFGSTLTERLVQVLLQCPLLEHLDFSGNSIGDIGAMSLAGVLGRFSSLKHLNLKWNQIGSIGIKSLTGVLEQCTALTHLDLNNNSIRLDGLKLLLQQCPSLKLGGNRITRL